MADQQDGGAVPNHQHKDLAAAIIQLRRVAGQIEQRQQQIEVDVRAMRNRDMNRVSSEHNAYLIITYGHQRDLRPLVNLFNGQPIMEFPQSPAHLWNYPDESLNVILRAIGMGSQLNLTAPLASKRHLIGHQWLRSTVESAMLFLSGQDYDQLYGQINGQINGQVSGQVSGQNHGQSHDQS